MKMNAQQISHSHLSDVVNNEFVVQQIAVIWKRKIEMRDQSMTKPIAKKNVTLEPGPSPRTTPTSFVNCLHDVSNITSMRDIPESMSLPHGTTQPSALRRERKHKQTQQQSINDDDDDGRNENANTTKI
jgi:hypothetical protein